MKESEGRNGRRGDSRSSRRIPTTLARSTLCILSARETHGHNANSFGSWLLEAGYEIAWDLVTQDEMLTASVASFHRGSSEAFATILNKIIRPVR